MIRILLAATIAVLLTSCAAQPVPIEVRGPSAAVADSMTPRSGTSVDFFVLEKYNGHPVDNALRDTAIASQDMGFFMNLKHRSRQVPASEAQFGILGTTHQAAPILALINGVTTVSGDVRFTPLADHSYMVKGVINKDHASVWIEDTATGQIMGRKVENKGP
jgi:hypothetical protein